MNTLAPVLKKFPVGGGESRLYGAGGWSFGEANQRFFMALALSRR
jgi:hypothetical protein